MTRYFEHFTSWAQLIDHVRAGYALWYQGPIDYCPVQVVAVVRKDGQIRVTPPYADADPFTADHDHLDRFRREEPRRTIDPARVTVSHDRYMVTGVQEEE